MMKGLTSDNVMLRPFRVHKLQDFLYTIDGNNNPPEIRVWVAADQSYATEVLSFSIGGLYQVGNTQQTIGDLYTSQDPANPDGTSVIILHSSLTQLFYNPLELVSTFNRYELGDAVYIISVAQPTYGEQIQPTSFVLTCGSSSIYDDGKGGLFASGAYGLLNDWQLNDTISDANFTRNSPAWYYSASRFIQVGNDVPRTSHYIRGTSTPSLLIESASTQFIRHTMNFTSMSTWDWLENLKFGTSSYTQSVFAGESASLLKVNSGSGNQYIAQYSLLTGSGEPLTVTCIIQNSSATESFFGIYNVAGLGFDDGALGSFAWFSRTATYRFPGTSISDLVVEPLPNDTYKVSFTCVPPKDSIMHAYFYPTAGKPTGSVILHYYGVESSTGPTSPVRTTGSVGGRASDRFTLGTVTVPKRLSIVSDFIDDNTPMLSGSIFLLGSGSDKIEIAVKNNIYVASYTRASHTVSSSLDLTRFGSLRGVTMRMRAEIYEDASIQLFGGVPPSLEFEGVRSAGLYVTGGYTSHIELGGQNSTCMGVLGNTLTQGSGSAIGRILYGLGLAVINKFDSGSVISMAGINLDSGSILDIQYRATQTIYERQIICTMEPGEFNYTINPSIYTSGSAVSGSGKLIDSIASGTLTPYMTTVGLYNSLGELVAIGKFPRPIKRASESQQTIVIRFDT
jgi:hypothetical protein